MKKISTFLSLLLLCSIAAFAQAPALVYTEASTLTLSGKLFPDTPNPYHRIDTVKYKGFTPGENGQVRMSCGISVAFQTDAEEIYLLPEYGNFGGASKGSPAIAANGFDLYVKRNGAWLWAANTCFGSHPSAPSRLITFEEKGMHECLLYLPLFSEVNSLKIGAPEGATIAASPQPFRHRVAVFGSSFTHGASCSRPAMPYPLQLQRITGIQFIDLGCSGNCKMQDYFARALAAADVDAFLFDSFSNPTVETIKKNLFPFIETIQASHPGKPLIFQKTIYRERRNFGRNFNRQEAERMAVVDSLMKIACKNYKDVYYIDCTNAADKYHETSQDGTHPSDYGYALWAASIRKPLLKILKKYGIK